MGDMADFAIDAAFDDVEHYYEYCTSDLYTQYEEGLIDELGGSSINPSSFIPARVDSRKLAGPRKLNGPGACPICRAPTELKTGVHGKFYGCSRFPKCKGNRNY